jgi:hypothetical protein
MSTDIFFRANTAGPFRERKMNIQGRVALVTGANRGLGLALTEALTAAGAAKI